MVFSNRYNSVLAGLDQAKKRSRRRATRHPPGGSGSVIEEFSRAVAEGQPSETVFRFLHADGTVRKVLSRRIPIRDHSGQVVMYQGFNVDITALDFMQTRLRRAERLATLGQVAAGIAHEIRKSFVGNRLDHLPPARRHRSRLTPSPRPCVILQETKRLDRIVNQIIDYARPGNRGVRLRHGTAGA